MNAAIFRIFFYFST
ncbi:pheST operon leader peptide PheM [Escherichia coli]|nr:pheST operon leader peptide PheM [Escherichia coli]HAH8493606.1 pheST operon leader peptide PheM [Escherichia coli]